MSGKKEVTIYDIAKALDLSASTVSRGLRDHPAIKQETIQRIKEMAGRLDYQQNTFASNLRKNRSHTIGVLLPRLDSSFQAAVVSGIEQVVSSRGYNMIISQSCESYEIEQQAIRTLFESRVDGILVSLAADTQCLDHFYRILKKGIPVVMFDRIIDQPGCSCSTIVIDNVAAGYDATHHLLEQGCRRIAYLGDNAACRVFEERMRGYLKALEEAGIPPDPELILTDRLNEACGVRIVARILAMERPPDGLFAANDVSAVAVMVELKARGIKVPGDIAVVGFNNVQISRAVEPPLTTIHYPAVEMGKLAATNLLEMLDGDNEVSAHHVVLRHELIIRGSSLRNKPGQIHDPAGNLVYGSN